jgi:hypothetical protein
MEEDKWDRSVLRKVPKRLKRHIELTATESKFEFLAEVKASKDTTTSQQKCAYTSLI